ncbi:MAG TPA: GWxTD domain-containing protein [Ignavibacteriaceae bacterium]|nr:GWxTD domain-containing protein [Ignavibacteriaceae bacterium]
MRIIGTNILAAVLVLYVSAVSAQEPDVNAFHSRGLTALKEGKIKEAEELFSRSAEEYSFAPSYFELAKIEFDKNTVYSRGKARTYIQKAIWKDPRNIDYRLLKAKLIDVFSSSMAYDVYEDILDIDSANTEALFNLGRISEDGFYEYHNSFMEYGPDASISYNDFAYKDFSKAETFFKKAINSDPGRIDSYMHLGYLYSEAGQYEDAIPLLNRVVQIDSSTKNAYLFLGYLYYKTFRDSSSQSAYKKALGLMTKEEKKDFQDSTTMMLWGDKENEPGNIEKSVNEFWDRRDPLYLTKYNERLLEHYSRVAYSNLMFSVTMQNIEGWKSDRGEIMVRYGEPLNRVRLRPYINAGGKTQMMLKTDLWVYKNKAFGFTDDFMNKNFRFSVPALNGRYLSQFSFDTYSYVTSLRRTEPEDYEPEFKGPVFTLPYSVIQFKDLDNDNNRNTRIYVNYALDISHKAELRNKYLLQHQSGLFLTDSNYNRTGQKVEDFTYLGSERELRLSRYEKYWVNSLELETKPDSVSLAFEVIRNLDGGVSTNHFRYLVKDFDTGKLEISDIVLASGIDKQSSGRYSLTRKKLNILPNPTQTFTRSTDIFLYYEVYNLEQDADRKTNFEQKITLKKVNENSFIENIFSSLAHLFSTKNEDEVTLTTNYQSLEKNTQVYLQLDMKGRRPGDYIITVTAADKLSGSAASSQTVLKWR